MKCPVCGTTIQELQSRRRAGCAVCYSHFRNEIREIISSIQSVAIVDESASPLLSMEESVGTFQDQLTRLQKQLEDAVEQENYELAAKLRDLISELNQTVQRL